MNDDYAAQRHLSRRELLRLAGLSGLTVAAAGVAAPLALPHAAVAASLQDPTPEGFLAAAYAQRAQAMSSGNTSLLDPLYDPASTTLLAFEKERVGFFRGGLGAPGRKIPILGYTSAIKLIDMQAIGSTVQARVYVTTSVQWIPRFQPIPPAAQTFRQSTQSASEVLWRVGHMGKSLARLAFAMRLCW